MQATDLKSEIWETQAQVDACLLETGVTPTKMVRWRQEGLLPEVVQVTDPYHGSTVYFPPGTCAQIDAAARLFKTKSLASWVGWQLWWEGYEVDEKYWREPLLKSAHTFEKHLLRVINYTRRSEDEPGQPTIQEKFARSRASNFILSRIRRRLWGKSLAAHIGVVLSVATGDFVGFSLPGPNEEKAFDQERSIEAFDFVGSQRDRIFEKQLNLIGALPDVLSTISRAIRPGVILKIAEGPESALIVARDDMRNAFRIAVSMFDAFSWIYGSEAFGLRLIAWVARKRTITADQLWILGRAALRNANIDSYSPAEIRGMAEQAEKARRDSLAIKALWKNDPRFREVFSPKSIRQAYRDKPSHENFQKEIGWARDSVK